MVLKYEKMVDLKKMVSMIFFKKKFYGSKYDFGKLWGQNMILGNHGVKMQFWKVLWSNKILKKFWIQNAILRSFWSKCNFRNFLGSKCNFGKVLGAKM